MIIVRIWGGLGNQMFQYAAARRLAHKHNTSLKLDINDLVLAHGYSIYGLRFFNTQENIAGLRDTLPYYPHGSLKRMATRMLGRRFYNLFLNRFIKDKKHYLKQRHHNYDPASKEVPELVVGRILSQRFFHFDSEVLEAPDNVYLMGFWISEKYFKDIEDIIRKEFTVKTPQTGKNKEIAEMLLNTESVSLHVRVREQEYSKHPEWREQYEIHNLDYYEQCIKYIVDKVKSPHFFVFSDDIPWAKENLKIPFPTTFVGHNDASTDYEDMRLMSQCKHNIISNSTFSWWGAWLNTNPDKIVSAPKEFTRLENFDSKDVYPNEWIKL